MVDRVDPLARRIGAVNTVVVAPDGSLEATNTDAFGFRENLREAAPRLEAEFGAGGDPRGRRRGARGDRGPQRCRRRGDPHRQSHARTSRGGRRDLATPQTKITIHSWERGEHRSTSRPGSWSMRRASGMVGEPAAEPRSLHHCRCRRLSSTSSMSHWRPNSWRRRGGAAIRPSTVSECSSIRAGPASRPGSARPCR